MNHIMSLQVVFVFSLVFLIVSARHGAAGASKHVAGSRRYNRRPRATRQRVKLDYVAKTAGQALDGESSPNDKTAGGNSTKTSQPLLVSETAGSSNSDANAYSRVEEHRTRRFHEMKTQIPVFCRTPPYARKEGAATLLPSEDRVFADFKKPKLGTTENNSSRNFWLPADFAKERRASRMFKDLLDSGAGEFRIDREALFSDLIPRHSLGTCAFVGLSSRLLGSCMGKAIDAHDTVIRFGNIPVKGWEKDVGSRNSVQLVRQPKTLNCSDLDGDIWKLKNGKKKKKDITTRPEQYYLVLRESIKCGEAKRLRQFRRIPVVYVEKYNEVIRPASLQFYHEFLTLDEMRTTVNTPSTKHTGDEWFQLCDCSTIVPGLQTSGPLWLRQGRRGTLFLQQALRYQGGDEEGNGGVSQART